MTTYVKAEIVTTSAEQSEILMSELSDNQFYAFEQEENSLLAYIKQIDFNEEKLKTLLPETATYTYSVIEDRNWNEEWESQLQPVFIHNFVGIRASFHEPLKHVAHEIIITPKMSFGTGHHATTFLMIELMANIDFKNKRVLDFGTGTGILSILSEKLGAASVTAIDCDEWSINNTRENIEANQCEYIFPEKSNNITGITFMDIILANINFTVLLENAENLSTLLRSPSILAISGILSKDEGAIISVFVKNGFVKKQMLQKEGWLALLFEKQ
ncbi:MAG: 50S ribosomal protein L11 methyltransferase [Ginsengibacter sp.]